MAQPTKQANDAARAKLIGPFYNPEAAKGAQVRADQLRDIILQLTDPMTLSAADQPSQNPFNLYGATRTSVDNGVRNSSMYYNQEPLRKIQQGLTSAKTEEEVVRAALAMFGSERPVQITPAISGPYRAEKLPTGNLIGKIGTLIDLLTYSPALNTGESTELAGKRGPEYTNRPEYEALLQQVLQSNANKFTPN